MWVLTRDVNEYDQFGEYFLDCWQDKPSELRLLDALTGYTDIMSTQRIAPLLLSEAGTRQGDGYSTFYLHEIENKS